MRCLTAPLDAYSSIPRVPSPLSLYPLLQQPRLLVRHELFPIRRTEDATEIVVSRVRLAG